VRVSLPENHHLMLTLILEQSKCFIEILFHVLSISVKVSEGRSCPRDSMIGPQCAILQTLGDIFL
jgi:hypothetical protein